MSTGTISGTNAASNKTSTGNAWHTSDSSDTTAYRTGERTKIYWDRTYNRALNHNSQRFNANEKRRWESAEVTRALSHRIVRTATSNSRELSAAEKRWTNLTRPRFEKSELTADQIALRKQRDIERQYQKLGCYPH